MALTPGTRLGAYEIADLIGAGGMGEVYKARDSRLDRFVAIKVLPGAPSATQGWERLLLEARAAAALSHPHICTIHDVGEADGRAFVVMEHIEGESLAAAIARGGLPVDAALRYGQQIAGALAHAHDRGIVHRDLKAANVMITTDGRAKVVDFGLARTLEAPDLDEVTRSRAPLEESGAFAGTLPYMSPETFRGEPASFRSDVWAFGVLLFEMLAGRRPFTGATIFEICSAVMTGRVPPLPVRVPGGLKSVLARCLDKDPGARYQRAGELRAAVDTVSATPRRHTRAPSPRRPQSSARASQPIRALAVLPLVNLSGDPEQEYFADGMTEALISNLARIGALKVISRTSVMRYKNGPKPLPEIARELKVDAVVEGSVIASGGRARITAQLIRASTETHLWTDSYDRDLRDVLSLQSELARAVAQQVRAIVTPQEQTRLESIREVNPEAYALYLKGRYYWARMGDARFRRSIEYFEQAVALDPLYAPAHAGIADYYNILAWFGWARPHDVVPKAKAAARRAIEIDESLAEAYAAIGYSAIYYDWDWAAAERALRRAIDLNPGYAMAHAYLAWLLCILGRNDEAITEAKRMVELDPLSVLLNAALGQDYQMVRHYGAARDQLERTLEMEPNSALVLWAISWVYLIEHRFTEAIEALQKAIALMGTDDFVPWLAYAYALAGRRAESAALAAKVIAKREAGYVPADDIARIFVALGESDTAFEWLNRACDERGGWIPYLGVDQTMDPIRDDPRFTALLRRVGL